MKIVVEHSGNVPDKCSPLIGHGWTRVPPQTQCTTTSAAKGTRFEGEGKQEQEGGEGKREKKENRKQNDHKGKKQRSWPREAP